MSRKQLPLDKIITGDCLEVLAKLGEGWADLIVADPPYNIGYRYDRYNDSQKHEDYCRWCRKWMLACKRALSATGSMYVAIGDDYAAQLRIIGRDIGLSLRNWIVWHYTFGQSTRNKFARSHIHIFYFVANPDEFTFNDDSVRVLSDRQKQYADKRANPAGKIPDDTWVVYPRVCGTFGERADGPNQLPEALLARIIRASSNPGEVVLDPFCGAGTTAAVAAQLQRHYLSIDISTEYAGKARRRVANTLKQAAKYKLNGFLPMQVIELVRLYQENEVPVGRLLEKPQFVKLFCEQLNRRLAEYSPDVAGPKLQGEQVASALSSLAKKNMLPVLRTDSPSLRSKEAGK